MKIDRVCGGSRVRAVLGTTCVFVLMACGAAGAPQADPAAIAALDSDLSDVRARIAAAEEEDAQLAGGLVKTLIALRLATLRNTEAMLEQKKLALEHGVVATYTMDGEVYVPPAPDPERLADLEQAIAEAQADVDAAKEEAARYSGGLVAAMAASRVATAENTLAMIRQRWYVENYSIPFVTPGNLPAATTVDTSSPEATSAVPAEGAPAEKTGAWEVSVETNPMDDSTTVVLALIASSGQSSMRRPVGLVLRCQSNRTSAYIVWNDYLGDEARVTSRVGDGESRTARWSVSTDKTATFVPGNPIDFIRQLIPASRFVAQVTPYNESPLTAVFELEGLDEAVKPLRETCSW